MNLFDVVIIGAGPAGSTCALALHNSGLKVALVEKENYPRDKICGDAIPGNAFRAIDTINPEWGRKLREFPDKMDIHSFKAVAPNGKAFTIPWVLFSYNCRRYNFDNFLFGLVSAETKTAIFEHQRLQQATVTEDGVECQFQEGLHLKAKIVIGCDGAYSVVKRQLLPDAPESRFKTIAVRAYFKNVTGLEKNTNEAYFINGVNGYFWIFPLENGLANVGFGMLEKQNLKTKRPANIRKTYLEMIQSYPGIASRFKNAEMAGDLKGYLLPFAMEKNVISGERFMLCGDAASLINPLTGHGIDKAMWSGMFAASQAAECIKTSDFTRDSLASYDARVYKKFGPEFRKNRIILRICMQFPWMINLITHLGRNQKLNIWLLRKLKI